MGKDTLTLSLFDNAPLLATPAPAKQAEFAAVDAILEEFNQEKQAKKNDSICKEWRSCIWSPACMTPENDETGICYRDEPQLLSLTAFSRDEIKVVAAGFPLVKYFREDKKLQISEADPANGWTVLEPFSTYAAAERKLKELKASGHIETGLDGKIIMSGWNQPGGLLEAGFEFYRCYGFNTYDQGCCIKQGSKNWSHWAKYPGPEDLKVAWNKLMQDPKALEG